MEDDKGKRKFPVHNFFNLYEMLKYERQGLLSEYLKAQFDAIEEEKQRKIATVEERYRERLEILAEMGDKEGYAYAIAHPEEIKEQLCYTVLDYIRIIQEQRKQSAKDLR